MKIKLNNSLFLSIKKFRQNFSLKFFLVGCGCGTILTGVIISVLLGFMLLFLTRLSPVTVSDYGEPIDPEINYSVMEKLQTFYKNIMFASSSEETDEIVFTGQEMDSLMKTGARAQELRLNGSIEINSSQADKRFFCSGEFKNQKFRICYTYRLISFKKFSLFFTIDAKFAIKIKDNKLALTFDYLKIGKLSLPPGLLNSHIGDRVKKILIGGDLITKLISELEIKGNTVYIKYHPAAIRDIMTNYIPDDSMNLNTK